MALFSVHKIYLFDAFVKTCFIYETDTFFCHNLQFIYNSSIFHLTIKFFFFLTASNMLEYMFSQTQINTYKSKIPGCCPYTENWGSEKNLYLAIIYAVGFLENACKMSDVTVFFVIKLPVFKD